MPRKSSHAAGEIGAPSSLSRGTAKRSLSVPSKRWQRFQAGSQGRGVRGKASRPRSSPAGDPDGQTRRCPTARSGTAHPCPFHRNCRFPGLWGGVAVPPPPPPVPHLSVSDGHRIGWGRSKKSMAIDFPSRRGRRPPLFPPEPGSPTHRASSRLPCSPKGCAASRLLAGSASGMGVPRGWAGEVGLARRSRGRTLQRGPGARSPP